MEIHVSPCVPQRRAAKQKMEDTTVACPSPVLKNKIKNNSGNEMFEREIAKQEMRGDEPSACEKGGARNERKSEISNLQND